MVALLEQVAAERVLLDRRDGDQNRNLILPAVDHLRHRIGQADIGDDDDPGLAGSAGVTIGHGDHGPFLDALDQMDRRFIDQRIEDRIIAGRRIEENVLDARGFELLHEQCAAGAFHFAHRGSRWTSLAEGVERLRHRPDRDRAHAERAQAGHQLPARQAVVQILLDEILHGSFLRPFSARRCRASADCPDAIDQRYHRRMLC